MTYIVVTTEDVGASGTQSIPGTYVSHSFGPKIRPPLDDPFTISGGGGSVTATYNPDPLVFPLQYVEYINPAGGTVRVNGVDAWTRVPGPSEAVHIVKMREDTKDKVEYTLTVISQEYTEDGLQTYSTTFQAKVYANYDPSKGLLTAAVDARRP
jgi:hypothetical protein